MAGHSKWANIKHRKGKADQAKGKIFSRVTKEIITAVKLGGSDPNINARLRLALDKARDANMPKENIERNIKKATSADQEDFKPITYELYGHGGVGLIVEVMTDNKNRASSEILIATQKRGGKIATPGAVAFNFNLKGVIHLTSEKPLSEEELFEWVSEAGADDFEKIEDTYVITTKPEALHEVKIAMEKRDLKIESAELEMIPKVTVDCNEQSLKSNLDLIDWLDELDDVDRVFHNINLPGEAHEKS
jgi:YebC/PmpR family DNA-binding regulatory protein